MEQTPNNEYFITYSNSFEFENRVFAFRKKKLFDITNLPIFIPFNEKANCWLINRKQITISKVNSLVKKIEKVVDVSDLQWYKQIELDLTFNL